MANKPGLITGSNRDTLIAESSPQDGTKGVFALHPGYTPKYAINRGQRQDQQHRETLARMFMSMSPSDRDYFLNRSGLDERTRQLFSRLTLGFDEESTGLDGQALVMGYMNFLLTGASHSYREKVQISEVLSDNYVAHFFGQEAPIFSYSGVFINTWQDDWLPNFLRLYSQVFRGTKLAGMRNALKLKYDSLIVTGTMLNVNWELNGTNEMLVPFSFQLLVKNVALDVTYDREMLHEDIATPYLTGVPTSGYQLLAETRVPRSVRLGAAAAPVNALSRPAGLSTSVPDVIDERSDFRKIGAEPPSDDSDGFDPGKVSSTVNDGASTSDRPLGPVVDGVISEPLAGTIFEGQETTEDFLLSQGL